MEKAKEQKNDMGKTADFESKQELAGFKRELDEKYNEIKAKTEAAIGQLNKYEDAAQVDIRQIHSQYEKNKDAVEAMLLD